MPLIRTTNLLFMMNIRILALLAISTTLARSEVRVSSLFGDHMVLQRAIPAPVWGLADPGEKVTVKFGEAEVAAEADANGKWMVKLPAMRFNATPRELTISGKNTLTIKNVVVGDVWVCSGQSNMEWGLGGCNAQEDIAAADVPNLRRIKLDHRALGGPSTEVPGHWEVCTPQSAPGFTAVGFYFARRVQKEVGVPIGLIDDNWGGTRIEPWIPRCGFEQEPPLANILQEVKDRQQAYRAELGKSLDAMEHWVAATRKALEAPDSLLPAIPPVPGNPGNDAGFPMTLYNGMIHPIVPFAIKGALWYQGESNGGEGDEYYSKMRALIGGWREVWSQGDFPFYFVQLANFEKVTQDPAGGDGWARLRMAQLKSLQIPKTGMAVVTDIGEARDIHPKNKFDVGERLALWALRNDYGKANLVVSGPLYKTIKVEDGKIRIEFDSVGGGLMAGKKEGRKPTLEEQGAKLQRFAIAGEDKRWVWADAVIDGETVVVSSPDVPKPVAVRYAFSMNPEGCNLYNKEGLPTSPFRTDNW
ncbi:MAG: 9-O-acetylesterase [Verrucomicrobia bacterium]|nr:9-O-acetylesterase [Verrucomicrobiota bacterium]